MLKWVMTCGITLLLLWSKANNIDSLLLQLETTKDDSSKAEIYNDLCFALCYSYQDSALAFGSKAYEIGKELNSPSIKARALNRVGIVFDIMGRWDTAMVCYQSAIWQAQKVRDTISLAGAHNNLGLIYWNKQQHDLALKNYMLALNYFQLKQKNIGVAHALNNISLIYDEIDSVDKAITYAHLALNLRLESNDEYGIGASYVNLGGFYNEIDSFELSKAFFLKGIKIKEKLLNDNYGLAIAYNDLSITFDNLGQYDSANYYAAKSVELHLRNKDYYRVSSSLLNQSSCQEKMGNYGKSMELLLAAEKYADMATAPRQLVKIYHALANLYLDQKNFEKAAHYLNARNELKDSLFTLEKNEKILEIQTQYETEKKDRHIADLKITQQENELKIAQNELSLAIRDRLILAGVILVFIVITGIVFVNSRKKARLKKLHNEAIIREKEQNIQHVFDATENEKQRIARDLHDGIGQQLSGLKMAFKNFGDSLENKSPQEKERLDQLQEILDQSARDLRAISHQMMPKTLSEFGLLPAIKGLIESQKNLVSFEIKFDYFQLSERYEAKVELCVFRVFQELLNNAIKHSQATEVNVQLIQNKQHLILLVEDNGLGMSLKNTNGHGFANIDARIQAVNGKMEIESKLHQGTSILIRIELA